MQAVSAVTLWLQVDHPNPLIDEPGVLSGANVVPRPAAAREQPVLFALTTDL